MAPTHPKAAECTLDEAIRTAPPEQLRALVSSICRRNEYARDAAATWLLVPLGDLSGRKRKAFELCKDCGQYFNVNHNRDGACLHHTGRKMVDENSDMWDDQTDAATDSPLHEAGGEVGFCWSCCQRPMSDKGCVATRHSEEVKEISGGQLGLGNRAARLAAGMQNMRL